MNRIVAAVAGAALLTAGPALAAPYHGGGGHQSVSAGASGRSGNGFRAGAYSGFHGGYRGGGSNGYHGGYGGGYYGHRGYGGYPYFFGGLGLGFGLASAFYDPWYYDYAPYYGYYGYEVVTPAPAAAYDDPWTWDDGAEDAAAPPQAAAPQASAQATTPQACGAWSWDANKGKYNWVPC